MVSYDDQQTFGLFFINAYNRISSWWILFPYQKVYYRHVTYVPHHSTPGGAVERQNLVQSTKKVLTPTPRYSSFMTFARRPVVKIIT